MKLVTDEALIKCSQISTRIYPVCSATSYGNPQQRALGERRTETTREIGLCDDIECI